MFQHGLPTKGVGKGRPSRQMVPRQQRRGGEKHSGVAGGLGLLEGSVRQWVSGEWAGESVGAGSPLLHFIPLENLRFP